jgi:hypothetical protein
LPRLRPAPDAIRYTAGHLFGPWEAVTPPDNSHHSPSAGRSPAARPKPARQAKPLRVSKYGGSQGRGDVAQQVATVREVMLARLDDLGATHLWPIAEAAGIEHDTFLDMYQKMLWALFPVEVADGEPYTPDPAERQGVPPDGVKVRKGGLFPYPAEGIGDARSISFARHFLMGEQSPAAKMADEEGRPVFGAGDLAVLGARIERRAANERSENGLLSR